MSTQRFTRVKPWQTHRSTGKVNRNIAPELKFQDHNGYQKYFGMNTKAIE